MKRRAALTDNCDVNSASAIASAIALGTLGVLSFIVQPALVQGFVTHLGLTESQAVNLAGLEMLGVAVATVGLAVPIRQIDWRIALLVGLALAVLGNLASAVLAVSPHLWAARLIAGLGHGAIISLSFTFIGLTARVARNVALYLVALLSYGASGLWLLPRLLDAIDISGLFLAFAALAATGLATVRHVPRHADARAAPNATARQLGVGMRGTALAGILAYNLAQGIAWSILFLVGIDAELTEHQVAQALFTSQIFAIAGALASVYLADRIGQSGPIAFGILAGGACIALLLTRPGLGIFLIAVCGFNLMWNFVLPFILGAVADLDLHGRMMGPSIAMQMIGLGGGPLLAAQFIADGTFRAAEIACIAFFAISYALLTIPMLRHRRLLAP